MLIQLVFWILYFIGFFMNESNWENYLGAFALFFFHWALNLLWIIAIWWPFAIFFLPCHMICFSLLLFAHLNRAYQSGNTTFWYMFSVLSLVVVFFELLRLVFRRGTRVRKLEMV
jgi:hypothetical protein